nr:MAG TPA: hypothetical protein [Caudoviricetes sp.]
MLFPMPPAPIPKNAEQKGQRADNGRDSDPQRPPGYAADADPRGAEKHKEQISLHLQSSFLSWYTVAIPLRGREEVAPSSLWLSVFSLSSPR